MYTIDLSIPHQPLPLHHLLYSADILILFSTHNTIFLLTTHSLTQLAALLLIFVASISSTSFASSYHLSIFIGAMMNLISFETPPPLGRQESTAATAATSMKVAKEASSSGACFHGSNLDLSLGISLSPGGNCSGASCGGAVMASYSSRRGGGNVGRVQSSGMVVSSTATVNTLSAGRGGNCHGIAPSSSWTAAFMPSPTGFMHPWSLAARQQKAAAEQDRSIAPASVATTYVTR